MIIGKNIVSFDTLDSTSDEARRRIRQGEGEGLVVMAASQSAGHGKPGAKWYSPRGNLYLSAVVAPRRNPGDLAILTLTTALAGRSCLQRFVKLPIIIKWPNDLLVRQKKIAGILIEGVPSGQLIIGIGINLASIPDEVSATATSLEK
jgi:BirA family biotin operon repressor/biotin-[acetyl-CoA-carboxylase] ligase